MTTTSRVVLPGEPQSRPIPRALCRVLPPDTQAWHTVCLGYSTVHFVGEDGSEDIAPAQAGHILSLIAAYSNAGHPFTIQLQPHPSDHNELGRQDFISDPIA